MPVLSLNAFEVGWYVLIDGNQSLLAANRGESYSVAVITVTYEHN